MKTMPGTGAPRRSAAPLRAIAMLVLAVGWAAAQAGVERPGEGQPAAGQAAQGVLAQPPAAQGAPADDRGRALYEARCQGCHDRSVHQRAARIARDYSGVRAGVERWDREQGALWRPDEIDAVTRYLNSRYYRFPCAGPGCAPDRASVERAAPAH
ncbi:hypothetical protein [Quisquiliibacterium transsilvanicum]|uniref:Mono/diheme cytochrome c family protein n=1 Tax=Quisquiliibacterium transsilvanicum TaxID=1549638 RepID=A0A7W8HH81_9BURK|nr:hypothetical protein [Quisquiliibacterium transsilvanicum]MBB5272012.1 mono/diheme cytochrome c family protein [Quisquiliibacterium transsilvanicum]